MSYLGETGSLSGGKSFGVKISEMVPRLVPFLVINKLLSRALPSMFASAPSILNSFPLVLWIFDSGDEVLLGVSGRHYSGVMVSSFGR